MRLGTRTLGLRTRPRTSRRTARPVRLGLVVASLLVALPAGCTVTSTTVRAEAPLPAGEGWALLPVTSYEEAPQVGERVEGMLQALAAARGLVELRRYPPPSADGAVELEERRRLERALTWARDAGLRYGLTGTVSEWRYKAGLDGEPAVGLTLQVIDVATGRVLYAASGARAGWARESLAGTAQKLLTRLLADLPLRPSGARPEAPRAEARGGRP